MKIYRFISLILAFLLINLQIANAASVLGKISVYTSPSSRPEVFPLVSGNRVAYENPAIVKINGGTLLTGKGTSFETLEEGETVVFRVGRGDIYFRLLPDKVRVSFKTGGGDIFSPKVALTSNSVIEGRINVGDRGTMVEVTKGSLEVETQEGISRINEGEKRFLAQADIAQGLMGSCPESSELVKLVGGNGIVDKTPLAPYGGVLAGGKVHNAVVVDRNLNILSDVKIDEGAELDILGVVIDKNNVIVDQKFLAKNGGQLDLSRVGSSVKECTLLVKLIDDTTDEGRLAAGLIGLGMILLAILLRGGGDGGDREASPVL